ncbi:MAG TPA: dihydroxyacetone kinase subunit DhaL [Symbiobacteriaceae bacterium]
MDVNGLVQLLNNIAKVLHEQADFLSELDNAIGDGDHGHNMDKGFKAVQERVLSNPDPDLGKILQKVGMTLISTVGGAAGPLYGTAFLRMGSQLAGKQEVTLQDLPKLMEVAIAGIQQRGKAVRGEKTMLDALIPAKEALDAALAAGKPAVEALSDAVAAAAEGVEYTKTIKATKGRASYLGERSIGHQDPGATSSYFMIRALRDTVAGA